ncbi:MAG TPA: AMP-binding protein, partial [Actinomycetota bacterium]|nr:AMP-binding protein [Actinomycetota bacterium]
MTDLQPWTSDLPAVDPGTVPMPEFVLERAARFGDKPALVDGPTGRTLTYRQLAGGVERVAAGLAARGFGKGDVLALSSPNLPEYALAMYGAMAAGGAVTGASPLLTAAELAGQLADSGASLLVTAPPFLEVARAAAEVAEVPEVLVLGEADGATPFRDLVAHDHLPASARIDPAADLAALPYSSGTTGLPKGVELTHANLVANARQSQDAIGFTADDVVIGVAPFFHAIGQNLILPCSLRAGATVVTMSRFDFPGFLELIQRYRVTSTVVVPPIMLALAGHPLVDAYDLSSLRFLGCGAAPLGAEVEQRCADRLGCQIAQGFGMTEGAAVFAIAPLDAARRGSAGRLLGGTEARIVDPDGGGDLGPGRTGELWLRGPQVMRGYRNRPEATARTIDPDGWLRTGDLCYLDADGYLFVVDRLKELIKYKGAQV